MKITDKIANYAELSTEERLSALEALDFEDNTEELNRAKQAVTNANREAAELKKQLKDANERATAGSSDAEKQLAAIKQELENERRARRVASYAAKFAAQGFDEELAQSQAELIGGLSEEDAKTYFSNVSAFIEAHDKAFKADLLKQTPRPGRGGVGEPSTGMTLKKLREMDPMARKEWATEHQEEYRRLYGG